MRNTNLSLATAAILRAVSDGHCYGFEIMEVTGLPSGTIYPALRRLEQARLIRSNREAAVPSAPPGPPRKYFRITAQGAAALEAASDRYPMLASQRE